MKVSVVGISSLDFKSNDGKAVKGTKLYIEYQDERVTGVKVAELFLNEERQEQLLEFSKNLQDYIGLTLDLQYDMKGKLIGYAIDE